MPWRTVPRRTGRYERCRAIAVVADPDFINLSHTDLSFSFHTVAQHVVTMRREWFSCFLAVAIYGYTVLATSSSAFPFVINTWGGSFVAATDAAFLALNDSAASALDAVQIGCGTCERNQCDGSVGYGGSPDENCETTLDAMIMDGTTMKSGAVAGLRRVRDAITAARLILDYTEHTMLAGDLATRFAVDFGGLREENLTTEASGARCEEWIAGACQPNYRTGSITPDPEIQCGPYTPTISNTISDRDGREDFTDRSAEIELKERLEEGGVLPIRSHDTISMVVIGVDGTMAAGTSTNGATHKVPGRVGDGPITGSGSYVDGDVGGCGATGDGDIMMRFLPCYQAVESLRRGLTPQAAADDAVVRMLQKYPLVSSGIVVVNNLGEHGGAASGWQGGTFTYSFRSGTMNETEVVTVASLSA